MSAALDTTAKTKKRTPKQRQMLHIARLIDIELRTHADADRMAVMLGRPTWYLIRLALRKGSKP